MGLFFNAYSTHVYVVLHSFDKISENYFLLQGLLVLLPSDDFVLNHSVPKKKFMLTLSKQRLQVIYRFLIIVG